MTRNRRRQAGATDEPLLDEGQRALGDDDTRTARDKGTSAQEKQTDDIDAHLSQDACANTACPEFDRNSEHGERADAGHDQEPTRPAAQPKRAQAHAVSALASHLLCTANARAHEHAYKSDAVVLDVLDVALLPKIANLHFFKFLRPTTTVPVHLKVHSTVLFDLLQPRGGPVVQMNGVQKRIPVCGGCVRFKSGSREINRVESTSMRRTTSHEHAPR